MKTLKKRVVKNFHPELEHQDIGMQFYTSVKKPSIKKLEEWLDKNPRTKIEAMSTNSSSDGHQIITIIAEVPNEDTEDYRHALRS